jgi:hypothetical protein
MPIRPPGGTAGPMIITATKQGGVISYVLAGILASFTVGRHLDPWWGPALSVGFPWAATALTRKNNQEPGRSPPKFRTPWAALGPGLVVAINRPRRHCGSHYLQWMVSFSRPELEHSAERDR